MKKAGYIFLIVCVSIVGATFFVKNVQAAKTQLLSLTSFVDELIGLGIIEENKERTAKEIVSLISAIDSDDVIDTPLHSDKVTVTVSQLIEHSDRTYNRFEDITGLLLLVKNTSDETITLEAKRKCQIVYTIYNEDEKAVYDKRDEAQCQTDEKVTYLLNAGQTRMFQIDHAASTYELTKGAYTFEIEYPGYGGGEMEIIVR